MFLLKLKLDNFCKADSYGYFITTVIIPELSFRVSKCSFIRYQQAHIDQLAP